MTVFLPQAFGPARRFAALSSGGHALPCLPGPALAPAASADCCLVRAELEHFKA